MELEEAEGAFIILSVDPIKPRQSFTCRASDARRQQWTATLSRILHSQREMIKRLENPLRTCDLHRDDARDPAA